MSENVCLEKFVAAGERVFVYSPQLFDTPQEIDSTVEDFVSGLVQYLFNDVLLETTKQLGGLHQRIAVRGKDSTLYEGVSFGIIGGKPQDGLIESYENKPSPRGQGSGGVYRDFDDKLGTLRSFATTPREDNLIIQYLSGRLGETGRYNALSNSCRDFSQFEFDKITSEVTRARMERRDPVFGR